MSKWKERKAKLGQRPPRVFATTDAEDEAAEAAERAAAKNSNSVKEPEKNKQEELNSPG